MERGLGERETAYSGMVKTKARERIGLVKLEIDRTEYHLRLRLYIVNF